MGSGQGLRRMSLLDRECNVCQTRTIRVIGTGIPVFIIIIVDGGMRSRGGLRAGHITTVDPASIGPTFARHDGDTALAGITVACAIRVASDGDRIALGRGCSNLSASRSPKRGARTSKCKSGRDHIMPQAKRASKRNRRVKAATGLGVGGLL